MFLSAVILALVVGALAGGGFPRLAELRLRWLPLLGVALALRRTIEDAAVQPDQDRDDLQVELDPCELLELAHCLLVGERRLAVRAG